MERDVGGGVGVTDNFATWYLRHTFIHQKFTLPTPKQDFKFPVVRKKIIGLYQLNLLW